MQGVQLVDHARAIIDQIRKLKSENHVSLKTDIQHLIVYSNDEGLLKLLQQEEQLIIGITKTQEINWKTGSLDQPVMHHENGVYSAQVVV